MPLELTVTNPVSEDELNAARELIDAFRASVLSLLEALDYCKAGDTVRLVHTLNYTPTPDGTDQRVTGVSLTVSVIDKDNPQ